MYIYIYILYVVYSIYNIIKYIYIYIYIYTSNINNILLYVPGNVPGTCECPLFCGFNLPKEGRNPNQNKGPHLGFRYICLVRGSQTTKASFATISGWELDPRYTESKGVHIHFAGKNISESCTWSSDTRCKAILVATTTHEKICSSTWKSICPIFRGWK